VNLVGHSMGGNVVDAVRPACRPQRIRRLVNLEGFGMPATIPAQAPGRYAQPGWTNSKTLHAGEMELKSL